MTNQNTVQDAVNPDSASAAGVEKDDADKPLANADGETAGLKAEERQPEKSDEDKVASDAARTLNERKQKASERIRELNAKWRETERQRDFLLRENEELWARLSPPDPSEFEDNADYVAAKLEQRQTEREISQNEKRIHEVEAARNAAVAEAWRTRSEDYKAEVPDFDEVVYGKLNDRISPDTALLIAELDEGPAVAYHLGNNLAEASRIQRLTGHARAIELGKLAGRLTAPAPRKVTTAPAPIKAVSGNGGGKSPPIDPSKMSFKEFKAWRERGGTL